MQAISHFIRTPPPTPFWWQAAKPGPYMTHFLFEPITPYNPSWVPIYYQAAEWIVVEGLTTYDVPFLPFVVKVKRTQLSNKAVKLIYWLEFPINFTHIKTKRLIVCGLNNIFGPLFFYTTICICLESLACQKCYLIRLPLDLVKTSLHLHHCTVKHFVLNTEPSASAQCLPIFLFSFTSFLLFCRRAQHVIVHSRYCWQSVTFRWECTMALQVTFIHYQT